MSNNNDRSDQFIQIRPWKDCLNNCKFCYLKAHKDRKTTLEQKKKRLTNALDLVKHLDAKTIGLIGGEFFEGQLKGCEDEWFAFIGALKNSGSEIFITANLIREQYLLNETIGALDNNVLICTSYDEADRFHTEADREKWFQNLSELHDRGVNIFCNCIATQDLFENDPELPDWLGFSLVDPHISLEWLEEIEDENYHEHLIADCHLFNLPERRTAIDWFKKHVDVARNYSDYSDNHSDFIYGFNENDEPEMELTDRHHSHMFMNSACNHPRISSCYADSDRCMMCDAWAVANSAKN